MYEARWFILFCLSRWNLPNHEAPCHALGIFKKILTNRGAPTWFEIVWNYNVDAIDYWAIFSMKIN